MWVKDFRWLLAALLVCGVLRGVFIFASFSDFQKDPDGYRQIAENIVNENVYGQAFVGLTQPTAYRPPLYPTLLSLFVTEPGPGLRGPNVPDWSLNLAAVAILHLVLSLVTVYFAFQYAGYFGIRGFAAFAVTLLVGLDPIGLRQSSLIMTETLAVFCATLGLCWLTRLFADKRGPVFSFGCGLALGIFALCRPTFLIWAGLVFVALLVRAIRSEPESRKPGLVGAGCLLIGVLVSLSPWMIRNQIVFGKPIFATTHGGYTVFLGNNDSFYDYLRSGNQQVWDGEEELRPIVSEIRQASTETHPQGKGNAVNEIKKDRLYYDKSIEVIKRRPGDFAYACLIRVVRFWSVIPNSPDRESTKQFMIRIGSAIWYSTVFLMALLGVYRLLRVILKGGQKSHEIWSRLYPALLLVVAFQGLHILYWSNMRMRAPLVVVIALLAVLAWADPLGGEADKKPDLKNEV